ncbi:MAG: TrmJ/YjtD family RNA methyltransferase [Candidatus Woesearchaeota archaeon]
MISIVLVKPVTPGNIGAVARVMKNFGFSRLILSNPECDHLSKESMDRASHAKDILKNAEVESLSSIAERHDYVIGTISKLGTDYNLPRCPLSPEELAGWIGSIKQTKGRLRIAVLFGNESYGLTNDDLSRCDFTTAIPTTRKYPAMNLSHAAAVVMYIIHSRTGSGKGKITEGIAPIGVKEKRQIERILDDVLERMDFATEEKRDTQKKLWKRLIGKSMMTRREAYALMGFLKKIKGGKDKVGTGQRGNR